MEPQELPPARSHDQRILFQDENTPVAVRGWRTDILPFIRTKWKSQSLRSEMMAAFVAAPPHFRPLSFESRRKMGHGTCVSIILL